MVRRTCETGGF